MDSKDFVIWLKGFSEACHEFHPTPKQWDRIKEVLYEVEDYEDNPGINWETEDWDGWQDNERPLSGKISSSAAITFTVNDSGSSTYMNTIWNDQMGCWHYTNYPEGFGYYTNNTGEGKKEKQQLND
jgi:hypothetical protein